MRKYIVAIMLAFAMLTSCVIDEGDNRKPIDIGEYVASMASGVPCLNPRRGLTLLSPVCRDPAIGV